MGRGADRRRGHTFAVARPKFLLPLLGEPIERDDAGNSARGNLVQPRTRDRVVWPETGRLVALVGLENIAVVDTEDTLLAVDRQAAQEVRRIVEPLKLMRRQRH